MASAQSAASDLVNARLIAAVLTPLAFGLGGLIGWLITLTF